MNVLMVDVGGTNVKVMASYEGEMRTMSSGEKLTDILDIDRKLDFADQRGIFAYPINRLAGFFPFGFGSTKSKTLTPNFLSPR